MSEHLKKAREALSKMCQYNIGSRQRWYHLEEALFATVDHQEAQSLLPQHQHHNRAEWLTTGPAEPLLSPEAQPSTEPLTTVAQWDAAEFTLRKTLESWQLGQVTTEYLVARVFQYAVLRDALPGDEQIVALAAQARQLISVSRVSNPSAVPFPLGDAASLGAPIKLEELRKHWIGHEQ